MSQYNDHVYYKHLGRKIKKYKDFFYISEYADDSAEIIKKLLELTQSSIGGYRASVESWLRNYYIDCDEKNIIPKFILKGFAINPEVAPKNQAVLIYDVKRKETKRIKIVDAYQLENFNSDITEKHLAYKYENDVAKLFQRIKEIAVAEKEEIKIIIYSIVFILLLHIEKSRFIFFAVSKQTGERCGIR